MAREIFISYRRSDAQHAAFALHAHLARAFGETQVFLDRERLQAGRDWSKGLAEAIGAARIVLAVMGPRWINAADDWGRRRIDDPEDWVRIELATALQRGIPVIPLMLDGFQAPPPEALNDALSGLALQQSHPLQNASWMSDVQHLIDLLAARLALPRRDREATPGTLSKPRKTIRRTALSDEEVLARLNNEGLAHWGLAHHTHPWVVVGTAQELARGYEFEGFYEAVDFMAVAARQVEAWKPPHHPRWQNQWKAVQVWFSTWDEGCRITDLDIQAAAALDRVYQDYLRGRLPRPDFGTLADGRTD